MNKKLNTALFFIVATSLNVLLILVLALALFIPFALFLAPLLPGQGTYNLLALVVIVLGATFGSFPIYRALITLFQKKVDMEKYFDPMVRSYAKRGRR